MPAPLPPTAERIEHLQPRRTRLTTVQAVLFVFWQANFFLIPHDFGTDRAVDRVKLVAYLVWAALLLVFIATGGNWWQPQAVRAILNDETTLLHRRRATEAGFLVGMVIALGCETASLFMAVPERAAVHIVMTAGVGSALFVFAALERRAQRGG
jgi:hypothetical protein